jgi:hypothetical protein
MKSDYHSANGNIERRTAMQEPPLSEHDRRRKRAVYAFQILCYGYLLTMFLIQMYMASTRNR